MSWKTSRRLKRKVQKLPLFAETAPLEEEAAVEEAAVEEEVIEGDDAEVSEEMSTEEFTITELTSNSDSFETLAAALEAADLSAVLSGEGPFTVFAPTDEAFADLPEGAVEQLLLPENKDLPGSGAHLPCCAWHGSVYRLRNG